jgi:hypothetical protein
VKHQPRERHGADNDQQDRFDFIANILFFHSKDSPLFKWILKKLLAC